MMLLSTYWSCHPFFSFSVTNVAHSKESKSKLVDVYTKKLTIRWTMLITWFFFPITFSVHFLKLLYNESSNRRRQFNYYFDFEKSKLIWMLANNFFPVMLEKSFFINGNSPKVSVNSGWINRDKLAFIKKTVEAKTTKKQ